ncbi:MAG: hypothetical protein M0Q93_00170 [Terrimicrobiaceae bacterium]|jgi:hypothetical protein|nr:hypothetical protein [Terrimicrobiaceae bacterium]
MKVTLSTGQQVHVDRDGLSDLTSEEFKALAPEDQQLVSEAEDAASKKECGFALGRSSFDYLDRTTANDRHSMQGVDQNV